jgi:hypothetical protein
MSLATARAKTELLTRRKESITEIARFAQVSARQTSPGSQRVALRVAHDGKKVLVLLDRKPLWSRWWLATDLGHSARSRESAAGIGCANEGMPRGGRRARLVGGMLMDWGLALDYAARAASEHKDLDVLQVFIRLSPSFHALTGLQVDVEIEPALTDDRLAAQPRRAE